MPRARHLYSRTINLNRAEQCRDPAQVPNSTWHLFPGRIAGFRCPGLQHYPQLGVLCTCGPHQVLASQLDLLLPELEVSLEVMYSTPDFSYK